MPRVTLFSATLGEDGKVEPPLGPLYIAAALENIGWDVDFRDYQLHPGCDPYDESRMRQFLEGHEPILLISCFVDMLPVVIAASETIKATRPDTTVILGGPGPTANAAAILRAFPWLDGIVMGEGEETIVEWARTFSECERTDAPPPAIKGMVYLRDGNTVEGAPRERISAEHYLWPAYHLLDWSRYSSARVVTTRGCPYRCSFCDVAPLWGRRAVYREVDDTIDEMILLRDQYGKREIAIVDDTFVLNRDRVRRFCERLIERDCGLKWGCFGRINLMSEKMIELMARAGCCAIFYGIDSGSPAVLRSTIKELDANTIYPTLEISAAYFDRIEASFIWGYPFETYDDFQQTLELAGRASHLAPKVNVQMHMLSPLPSSPLYKDFAGPLLNPEIEDRDWLLLPALLLDERAASLRRIVDRAPHLFPGFFTFPTPDKVQKRNDLRRALKALDHAVGMTMFDDNVGNLLNNEDRTTELRLLGGAASADEQIGVGLALGLFRRTRRREEAKSRGRDADRGASLVRQRNDELMWR
jgi:anaerobic magnesium-protoporphyrin IX monomethyl ester cyclase